MLITIIDNYDSFVFNLVRYLEETENNEIIVMKNDAVDWEILDKSDGILLSPGPGLPNEAGNLMQVISRYHDTKNILGVFEDEASATEAYNIAMKSPEGTFVSFTMGTLFAKSKFAFQYTETTGHQAKIKVKGNGNLKLFNLPSINVPNTLEVYEPEHEENIQITVSGMEGFIEDNYTNYDGFVILHGSDTMAYTASALSFMLEGINKAAILTGSQITIGVRRSDAKENLITAVEIAASGKAHEVCIYFEDQLYKGSRTVKVNTEQFEAFESPNYPILAEAGVRIKYKKTLQKKEDKKLVVHKSLSNDVAILKFFPGITIAKY